MRRKIDFDFGGRKRAEQAKKKGLVKGLAAGIAAGSALGALSGILFAPKSGKETRLKIADDVSDAAKKAVGDIKDAGEKTASSIKDMAVKANDLINEKIKNKNQYCCDEVVETANEDIIEVVDENVPETASEVMEFEAAQKYSNENMEEDTPKDETL